MSTITEEKVAQVLTTLEQRVEELAETQRREREEHETTERRMRERAIELGRSNGIDMHKVGEMFGDLGWEGVPIRVSETWDVHFEQRIYNHYDLSLPDGQLAIRRTGANATPALKWSVHITVARDVPSDGEDDCFCSEAEGLQAWADLPEHVKARINEFLDPNVDERADLTITASPLSCSGDVCRNA